MGMDQAVQEITRRGVAYITLPQPPDCPKGSGWREVGNYYHAKFGATHLNFEMLIGARDFQEDWMPQGWRAAVESKLEKDSAVTPHPQKWIKGLGRFQDSPVAPLFIEIATPEEEILIPPSRASSESSVDGPVMTTSCCIQ